MKTTAIRAALEALEDHSTTDCQSSEAAQEVQAKLGAAWSEMLTLEKSDEWNAAIEAAAKMLECGPRCHPRDELCDHMNRAQNIRALKREAK